MMLKEAAALGLALALSGCFQASFHEEWSDEKRLEPAAWSEHKAVFRGFRIGRVSGRAVATAYGPGGVATATAESTTTASHVELEVLETAQESLPFRAVSPTLAVGEAPQYVLEGALDVEWSTPWWTWLQVLDCWVHTMFMPTFGQRCEMQFELALYDRDFQLLKRWRGQRNLVFLAVVFGVGSVKEVEPSGYHEEALAFLRDGFARVGRDMTEHMTAAGGDK